jgi:single-strand DNA-binding protein
MIIGNVGRDPEMRYMSSGRPVTLFSVATTRRWKTLEGERREDTEWFNVVAWGNLAEICKQHLCKGQQVYVEGRLQTRSWEGQEGKKNYRAELVANEMIVLGDRRSLEPAEADTDEEDFLF